MPTANSGADFPTPNLDLPGGQYFLACGCAQLAVGRAVQRALSFPVGE